jgi:hypothetical protein
MNSGMKLPVLTPCAIVCQLELFLPLGIFDNVRKGFLLNTYNAHDSSQPKNNALFLKYQQ